MVERIHRHEHRRSRYAFKPEREASAHRAVQAPQRWALHQAQAITRTRKAWLRRKPAKHLQSFRSLKSKLLQDCLGGWGSMKAEPQATATLMPQPSLLVMPATAASGLGAH